MARITCNFYSYSVGYPIDIQIILPSLSPCDGDVMPELTHKITEKYKMKVTVQSQPPKCYAFRRCGVSAK